MSYSISITGHKATGSQEESEIFEKEIAEKAKEFVSGLEGVAAGNFSGGVIGSVNLMESGDQ